MKNASDSPNKAPDLTISERVRAALLLFHEAGDIRRLSVSKVCRAAGVNRANLYANHRDLVEEILKYSMDAFSSPNPTRKRKSRQQVKTLAARLKDSEARYQALMIVCIEQQAEISTLRARLSTSPASGSVAVRARGI